MDLVIAVYKKDCYAGETILRLVDVIHNKEVPAEYENYNYELKIKALVDFEME